MFYSKLLLPAIISTRAVAKRQEISFSSILVSISEIHCDGTAARNNRRKSHCSTNDNRNYRGKAAIVFMNSAIRTRNLEMSFPEIATRRKLVSLLLSHNSRQEPRRRKSSVKITLHQKKENKARREPKSHSFSNASYLV